MSEFWDAHDYKKLLDAHYRRYGIDIAVIDDSDFVGFAASATRIDEVYMHDVKSMVANVLNKKGKYEIRRLDILDHGNDYSFQIGDDWISPKTLAKFQPELSKLRGQFSTHGFVHLQHCDIGMNKELLAALAKIWDVSVYAGTGSHNPVYRFNTGKYVRADPNGWVRPAGRPDQDSYWTYIGMRDSDPPIFTAPEEEVSMSYQQVAYETVPPLPKPKPRKAPKLIK